METMSSNASTTKRKKRKSRKCLDEIRKRSRRIRDGSGNTFRKSHLVGKCETVTNGARLKNCITSNRLTLAMFPKAVMSETITRPTVAQFRINPVKIANGVPQGTVGSNIPKIPEPPFSYDDSDVIGNSKEGSSNSKCNINMGMPDHSDTDSAHRSRREGSPGSYLLFSPMEPPAPAETDIFDDSPDGETKSTLTTPASQSSREGYGYHLYEEFMNEIPTYLKEDAPALINDDVMKKTRTFLHNIYMEGCRRECGDNVLQCIRNSAATQQQQRTPVTPHSQVAISQNSQDSIKIGYSWCPLAAAPRSQAEGAARARDSPEYAYYPHKLHQCQ